MGEKIGLESKEIKFVKKNDELISKIMEVRRISQGKATLVADMLRYNMWTVNQFCDLTGYKASTIANKTRPHYEGTKLVTELDFCFPFKSLESDGPKFIVRNENSEEMLPKVE